MATQIGAERFYSRYGNPTVRAFEEAMATMEGAEAAETAVPKSIAVLQQAWQQAVS